MAESNCKCSACARCCKFLPGALMRVEDLERIEVATRVEGESEDDWAARMFVASAGALIKNKDTGESFEVPTLALWSRMNLSCVHFNRGRCSIYDARPSGCSEFDSCKQTDDEAESLGKEMHIDRYIEFIKGGRYATIWEMLDDKGYRRSRASVKKRVAKLNKIYKKRPTQC